MSTAVNLDRLFALAEEQYTDLEPALVGLGPLAAEREKRKAYKAQAREVEREGRCGAVLAHRGCAPVIFG